RVGHIDAVLAHAPGEGERCVLHRRLLLFRELRLGRLEQRLASLLRRVGLGLVPGVYGQPDPAARTRVGHVDAVLAHALDEGERRVLRVLARRPLGTVAAAVVAPARTAKGCTAP